MLTKEHLTKITGNLLLIGKTGTGKSYLAKWIHKNSCNRSHQFIQLNIASLNKNLFESELFGHLKGSFTGAINNKVGYCESVASGTLFLDEIGELSLEQQKVLLTLLEERIFYSVGSQVAKNFKGRFIFATNKDLKEEVIKGSFREDLYHRLRAYTYQLEEFNSRKDKRLKIIEEFHNSKFRANKCNLRMSQNLKNFLYNYHFPGNYRELLQLLDYIVFVSEGESKLSDLPEWIEKEKETIVKSDSYYSALSMFEKNFLEEKLYKYQGRINYTAQMIEISKVTLISKIKKYGINVEEFKINQAIGS